VSFILSAGFLDVAPPAEQLRISTFSLTPEHSQTALPAFRVAMMWISAPSNTIDVQLISRATHNTYPA